MRAAGVLFAALLLPSAAVRADGPRSVNFGGQDEEAFVAWTDDGAIFALPYAGKFARLDGRSFSFGEDGFLRLEHGKRRFVIIGGDEISLKISPSDGAITGFPFADRNLKAVAASSTLSESVRGRRTDYSAGNLYKCLFHLDGTYTWNRRHIPWAEGAEGHGIGESVEIEWKNPAVALSVLGGYVDVDRPGLYKENSRPKEIEVEDVETGRRQTAVLEDKVQFTLIPLAEPARKVRLTIKSVYPGTKYADTCISAIVDHTHIEEKYIGTYLRENMGRWRQEGQDSVLDDCFSGRTF